MVFTHGGKNTMVCLTCNTLSCTPVCTGEERTTLEMMWKMLICHITLNILTKELRRSDMAKQSREFLQNILKNTFFSLINWCGSATYAYFNDSAECWIIQSSCIYLHEYVNGNMKYTATVHGLINQSFIFISNSS